MINNPIIQRELVSQLRTRKALAVQVLLVVMLSILVVLRWPTEGRISIELQQSQQVLQLFGYGMLVVLMLLVPAFPATSIVREKLGGTLALLLNSSLSRWSILVGKLAGALGFALLLMLLSMPMAAACMAMGGVGQAQIFKVYGILLMVTLQYSTLALLVSSFAARPESAMRLTYGIILGMAVFTLGPQQFLGRLMPEPYTTIIDWVKCVSPVPAMMEALGQADIMAKGLKAGGGDAQRFMLLALISSIAFALWTGLRLSFRMFDKPRSKGRVTDERSALVQVFRRVMYLWFFDPQRRSKLIGPMTNPVMIKEMRSRRFGRSHWTARLFALCLVISLALTIFTTMGTETWGVAELGQIVVIMQFALIVLLTPSLAGGMIASEIESGGWQLLQMTPLSAMTIVIGKLLSALMSLLLVLVATVPCYLVMIRIDTSVGWIVMTGVTLALSTAMALLVSAAVSSVIHSTAAATATSYAILIGLVAGTMLFWLGRDAPFSHDMVEAVLMLNPLAAALSVLGSRGFDTYQLVPGNWIFVGAVCVVSMVVLTFQTWRLTRPQ